MKNELERIWVKRRLAFPCHIAKWEMIKINNGLWFWLDVNWYIIALRGKRLDPIRKIYKIWR